MASLRHRRGTGVAEDYDDDDGSGTAPYTDTATEEEDEDEEEEEEQEERRLHLGLNSMTAKGIQHLCSELLEIKKASERDFSANVYLSYLSFVRMFQASGDLDKDVHHLKRQVMAHRRLIQHLSANCLYSSSSSSLALPGSGSKADDDDMDGIIDGDHDEELELDVLLSEHRTDEAIRLLELQGQALQAMQQAAGADDEAVASGARALSARKARVAGRLESVADHPRTPRPELVRALSGLCRLGEADRASHLLFKSHRAAVVRRVEELRRAAQQGHDHHGGGGGSGGNYIRDLARVVFSSIVQTSRSFVALHGDPSPQLVRWAREEMEDLSAAFSEYVASMSHGAAGAGHCLALALEAAECAVSYSPLLRPLGIVASEQDVVGLVLPCIRDAVAMYGRHLKEVVRLLVASDGWVLGRFLMPPGMVQQVAGAVQPEHCLLTTSGRKFVTLIQEVVEDVAWPLHNLGIGTNDSVGLQLVAELFREYMHSIVELIPGKEAEAAALPLQDDANGEEQYTWQLSVLINCTTLVSLFPIMASGVFRTRAPSSSDFPAPAQREVDGLISLIKEAAGQVWNCFCQQFIRDTMSSSSAQDRRRPGTPRSSPPQGMMPSMAFQVVFLRVRRLNDVYGSILSGKDGTMKKLLQELMEAMIAWLSGNLDSWVVHGAQVRLDVHFLLEFAQLGGFSSENLRSSALELLVKAEEKAADLDGTSGVIGVEDGGGGWAADAAAKHAVQVLLTADGKSDDVPRNGGNVEEAGQDQEAPEDEDEDEDEDERAAAKSSDEFISMEDDDEDDGGVRMPPPNFSSDNQRPGSSELAGDGEERTDVRCDHRPELIEQAGGDDDDVRASDNEAQDDPEGMCHDAVQVEEQSSSSWEDIYSEGGGGGRSRTRRQSTPPAAVAEKDAPYRSRKKREAVSRSRKPRWHI